MTGEAIISWILGSIASSGILVILGWLLRDTIAKFLVKSVEHRFDTRLEHVRSEMRDQEQELQQMRAFLISAQRDRDTAIQAKKFEAAETLFRARQILSRFAMVVEYMKVLNIENILKDNSHRVAPFFSDINKITNVDKGIEQLGSIDKTLPRLYLSEKTLKYYDMYESIVTHGIMLMKMFSLEIRDKSSLLKQGGISKEIMTLIPNSKEAFDKYGDGHAFYWADYFYNQTLLELRREVSGVDDAERDKASLLQVGLESRRAQTKIRLDLQSAGVPPTLVKPVESVEASQNAVERTDKE